MEEYGRRNNRQSQNNGVKIDDSIMFEKDFSIKLAARSSSNRFAAGPSGKQRA